MIDIRLIRDDENSVRENLKRRKEPVLLDYLDDVIKFDVSYRKSLKKVQDLRHERNTKSQEINVLKKQGKDFKSVIKYVQEVNKDLLKAENALEKNQTKLNELLMKLPNMMHESVPYGEDDTKNVLVRAWGKTTESKFKLKNHGELAENLGIADFDRATKISGAGYNFMLGDLVLLNRALMNLALDMLIKKGFTPCEPPEMMRRKPYSGVTDLSDFENVMYKAEGDDAYLIATSEHPIAAMHMDETILETNLPLKYAGTSINFRKEIGSRGIDEKGFFRMHQFWKIEQLVFCTPEDSWKIHEELIKNAEEFFQALELPYRVVNICTGDLGTVAAKKYDIEAWMPRSKEYKEVVSCSNCTDYQARRLNIRCRDKHGNNRIMHTLNSTMVATSRAIVAILENYQNEDGTVTVPTALQKYMGKKIIKAQKLL